MKPSTRIGRLRRHQLRIALAHTIVFPRSIQKTSENIGFGNRALPMEDRDFHDSAPAIRKAASPPPMRGEGAGPSGDGAEAVGALDSAIFGC